jgi:hypothetical protein
MRLAPTGCVVDPAATTEQPLEGAIVRALAAEPGRPAANQRLVTAPEMTELREHLTSQGLIVDGRMTQMIRLGALWPVVVVGFGLPVVDADNESPATWIAVAAAVAVTIAGARFGVPRRPSAARRAIEQAAAHRQDAADRLTRRLANVGFGMEDPELRDAGVDPMVVAAHGPIVLSSADPMLAVAPGGSAPTPARHGLLHADAGTARSAPRRRRHGTVCSTPTRPSTTAPLSTTACSATAGSPDGRGVFEREPRIAGRESNGCRYRALTVATATLSRGGGPRKRRAAPTCARGAGLEPATTSSKGR